jgi:hypothetical protein
MSAGTYHYTIVDPRFNSRRIIGLAIFMTVVTLGVSGFFIYKNLEQYPYKFNIDILIVVSWIFIGIIVVWFLSSLGKKMTFKIAPDELVVSSLDKQRVVARVVRANVQSIIFVPSHFLDLFSATKVEITWAINIQCSDQGSWYYQLPYETIASLAELCMQAGYPVREIEPEHLAFYEKQVKNRRYLGWFLSFGIGLKILAMLYEWYRARI